MINKRVAAEQRISVAQAQKQAAESLRGFAHDLRSRVEELARRLDMTSVEERHEIIAALFPKRGPYGVRLFSDGRIEAVGYRSDAT